MVKRHAWREYEDIHIVSICGDTDESRCRRDVVHVRRVSKGVGKYGGKCQRCIKIESIVKLSDRPSSLIFLEFGFVDVVGERDVLA